jgi:hypothetical protein
LTGIKNLIAIATNEPLDTDVRQFSIDDPTSIADFIEEEYIKPQGERLSLYVNDELMTLSEFPHQIITNLLLAAANSLKGVKNVRNLKIFYRK